MLDEFGHSRGCRSLSCFSKNKSRREKLRQDDLYHHFSKKVVNSKEPKPAHHRTGEAVIPKKRDKHVADDDLYRRLLRQEVRDKFEGSTFSVKDAGIRCHETSPKRQKEDDDLRRESDATLHGNKGDIPSLLDVLKDNYYVVLTFLDEFLLSLRLSFNLGPQLLYLFGQSGTVGL
ncbi:unnamed protein product [Ilex paraguariensis]|uniref:Uncharacterized protein n=1 Tax=Ilex paraguariensis TaxID=185542 RepID=A0ABC8TZK3_9AQUA